MSSARKIRKLGLVEGPAAWARMNAKQMKNAKMANRVSRRAVDCVFIKDIVRAGRLPCMCAPRRA
jgi:hypothetical protein